MKKKKFNISLELIETINKGECVLFLASGLSSNVIRTNGKSLPSWGQFLNELLSWAKDKRAPFNSDPDEIEDMIKKGNLLMAAEELQEIINPNEFGEFLNLVFRDKAVKPTKSHNLLTKIPFRSILTTNYDYLIEAAYTVSSGGQIPRKFTQFDLDASLSPLRNKEFFIFKMHGDIDRPNTIILGTRSYQNLVYKSPDYLSFLETLFTTHTVLFMGFGGSDPDLDYILDRLSTIFSRTLNKHYILVPDSKFNFTEKRRLLLDKRLEVIEYNPENNHEEVHEFIENIHEILSKAKKSDELVKSKKTKLTYVMLIHSFDKEEQELAGRITKHIDTLNEFHVSQWSNLSFFTDDQELSDERIKILLGTDSEEISSFKPEISIILITENALKSVRFESEVELTLLKQIDEKLKIIPIVIGNIDIPFKLRNYQHLRLPEDFNKNHLIMLEELLKNSGANMH